MTNEIKIKYPRTDYIVLNEYIKEKIENIIKEFMEYAKEAPQKEIVYSLYITYKSYIYQNYISYVFSISMYTGGAHPDNRILSVNYNVKHNKIIKITDIYNNLTKLSEISRKLLKNKNEINSITLPLDMILEGTTPNDYNFRNYALTDNGVIIFFEPYQVAPYAAGTIEITIPYNI
ncbi:MAG: DUF3298 domain-containing protein [Bacilli bacterium]|nr:DUF3298 domain-containing protein [Bacilli bacterium]